MSGAELSPWWEETEDRKILKAATGLFQEYVTDDQARLSAQNAYQRIYTNREIWGSSHLSMYHAAFAGGGTKYSRVPLNVAKVFVDAVHARVTRQSIAVKFMTDAGNFSLRKGARQMERWVDFQDNQQGGEVIYKTVYRDAVVGGTGVVTTEMHPKIDDVVIERVRATDVFVDAHQAVVNDHVCDLFRRKWVSRSTLKALYPECKDEIQKAGELTPVDPNNPPRRFGSSNRRSLVEVICGWKLPSYKDAGDGRYVVFIDGKILDSGDWDLEDYPLTFIKWKEDPTVGFWGIGLVEEVMGIHFDINNSLYQVYRAVELMPKPVAFLPAGGKIVEGQIGNVPGLIINTVDGNARLELPMSVPTDIADLILMQWGKGLEISRLAAMSLPESTGSGFETGQALRDFNDIQSTELAPNFLDWQNFRKRTAEKLVTGGKQVADRAKEEDRVFKIVMAKDKNTIEEIDWTNISIDPRRDSYVIKALPASALSQTFAGKKADVIDLLNAQLIDKDTAMALLDFPDLPEFFNMINGQMKAIKRDIEVILDDGEMVPFDPNNNLRLGLKLFQEAIGNAQAMTVPNDRIQLLRDVVEQILGYIKEEQMATRNMAQGIAAGPPGSPPATDINGATPQANAEGMVQ